MKIYIVQGSWEYEGSEILKVFAARNAADDFGVQCKENGGYQEVPGGPFTHYDSFTVSEHSVEDYAVATSAIDALTVIYETIVNSDGSARRGHDVVIGRFFTEAAAKSYGCGKDTMGTDGKVRQQYAVKDVTGNYRVLGPPVVVIESEDEIKRNNALAKLTAEERQLLGLG